MGDHDITPTCITAQPHEPEAIRDHLLHYFGCIRVSERKSFLREDSPVWEHERMVELRKIRRHDAKRFPDDESQEWEAAERVRKRIGTLAVSIEAQYRRTDVLRAALCKPSMVRQGEPVAGDRRQKTSRHLVDSITQSHREWKESEQFRTGIAQVIAWREANDSAEGTEDDVAEEETRAGHGAQHPRSAGDLDVEPERHIVQQIAWRHQGQRPPVEDADTVIYSLERDINAYIIQYKKSGEPGPKRVLSGIPEKSPPTSPQFTNQSKPTSRQNSIAQSEGDAEIEEHYVHVAEPPTDRRFKGQFPDQRVALECVLDKDGFVLDKDGRPQRDILLSRDRTPTRLRYFHVPCNNMDWVEQMIARYFDEERPTYDGIFKSPSLKTRSHMLLRPEFWRGQQHGGRSAVVHARHLRPLCETVSSDTGEVEQTPRNIVLFMPYLHWETDRRRETIAKVIDDESENQRRKKELMNLEDKQRRQQLRKSLGCGQQRVEHPRENPNPLVPTTTTRTRPDLERKESGPLRTFTEVIGAMMNKDYRTRDSNGIEFDEHGRMMVASKLGQFLIDSARLYEAMAIYRDKRLVEEYLYHEPPLHPRRTLDQSYYWTLKTTKARDRDQVVYRGTNMNANFSHKFQKVKEVSGKKRWKFWDRAEEDCECKWQWSDHWSKTDQHGCEQCRSDIRKISRVVMVDQLWMWILDEHTIITCFPRRYGANKHDPSGVHRSIRARLKSARKNNIRSVFDLALIILDECSNTFFDRTKTQDRQPQVMDIFAEAIGKVTNQQTISFQHLWHWTEKASKIYRSGSKNVDSSGLHVPLLDINPEGRLQREIKDIIDELDIMLHVNQKQREVLKRFARHVEHILDPEGEWNKGAAAHGHEWDDGRRPPPPKVVRGHDPERKERRAQFNWFRIQAFELLSEVTDRIDELDGLKRSAQSTAQSVNDLLALKQQQASVVQAWQAVMQSEETVRQGRAIMVFTIVTIVFLPLSFVSGVFGMNNSDFSGDTWSLADQFRLMFPISFGIIIVTVVVAFSNFLRAIIWSASTYAATWLAVRTGLYNLWLTGREEWHSQRLMLRTEQRVRALKEAVRRAKKVRLAERNARLRREADGNGDGDGGAGGGGGGGDGSGGGAAANGLMSTMATATARALSGTNGTISHRVGPASTDQDRNPTVRIQSRVAVPNGTPTVVTGDAGAMV